MQTIRVNKAINQAMQRTGDLLFRPFNIGKWFALGFCAFLANLTTGNVNITFHGGSGGLQSLVSMLGGPTNGQSITTWFSQNFWGILSVLGIVALVVLFVVTLVVWLQSRGTFMFIHSIAYNHVTVSESWSRHRRLGNSLFLMRILVLLITFLAALAGAGVALWIAWPDWQAGQLGDRAELGSLVLVIWSVHVAFTYLQIASLLSQLVSPVMYAGDLTVWPAFKRVWREMIVGQFWAVTRFYLVLGLVTFACSIITGTMMCMTACLTLVPYIGTVILLPLFVFTRSYSMYFVDQFGAELRVFPVEVDSPTCSVCGYDLRGNPHALACPECGQPIDAATASRSCTFFSGS